MNCTRPLWTPGQCSRYSTTGVSETVSQTELEPHTSRATHSSAQSARGSFSRDSFRHTIGSFVMSTNVRRTLKLPKTRNNVVGVKGFPRPVPVLKVDFSFSVCYRYMLSLWVCSSGHHFLHFREPSGEFRNASGATPGTMIGVEWEEYIDGAADTTSRSANITIINYR